jgi:dissimilatory sulfite reductase (desulfoviridin) alpha/beta subunit
MTWKAKSGSGLWTEYVNDQTGESSIGEHEPRVVKKWCPKGTHDFRIVDIKKRLAKCIKCDQEVNFVVGKDKIDGDKVTIN